MNKMIRVWERVNECYNARECPVLFYKTSKWYNVTVGIWKCITYTIVMCEKKTTLRYIYMYWLSFYGKIQCHCYPARQTIQQLISSLNFNSIYPHFEREKKNYILCLLFWSWFNRFIHLIRFCWCFVWVCYV